MADLIERLEADKQRLFGLGLKRMADDIAEAQAEIERLKTQKQKWLQNIADNQLANAPNEGNTTHEHTYRSGVYMGLQMAWDILTEGR